MGKHKYMHMIDFEQNTILSHNYIHIHAFCTDKTFPLAYSQNTHPCVRAEIGHVFLDFVNFESFTHISDP